MSATMLIDQPRQQHRWTVTEYHKMVKAGLLAENSRVELIDGEIIEMAPICSPHAGKVTRLIRLFSTAIGNKALVSAQNPVVLDEHNEPQPDVAVLHWRDDYYENAHPRPEDIILLIEVSDTTVRYDREIKMPLYARSGVPETWLVNLQTRRLEVYCDPKSGHYRRVEEYHSGCVASASLPDVAIDIAELFPGKDSSLE